MSDHREPLRGVVALEEQQQPPAVPVSPQACPAHFCHLLPDGAPWLQPVDVERQVIEGGRGSNDAVSVDKDDNRDTGEELPRAILMKVSLGKRNVAAVWPETQVHQVWQIGKPTKPLTSLSRFGVSACEVAGRCQ